jgi:hypothetical protein|uniref:Uncharacterized protein n=1 Tax=Picea glauca TaxID=3330 RepID=A0A101LVS0_PICGL|nr:hypothetical protein ABT39_MTgene1738 [Picea glauca]KUM48748.1 hypothetical protein ABT39_MTgene4763 [Picea glauca]
MLAVQEVTLQQWKELQSRFKALRVSWSGCGKVGSCCWGFVGHWGSGLYFSSSLKAPSRVFFNRNSFCVLLDFTLSLSPPLLTFAGALRNLLRLVLGLAFLAGRVEMRDPRAVIQKPRMHFDY